MSVIPRGPSSKRVETRRNLVSGRVALRGSDILEPGTKFRAFERRGGQQKEAEEPHPGQGSQPRLVPVRAPFPVVYEDDNVFIYEKPAGGFVLPKPKVKRHIQR